MEDIAGANDGWGVCVCSNNQEEKDQWICECRALKGILFKGAESLKRKKIFDKKKKSLGRTVDF